MAIQGLELFRNAFANYNDQYTLIGGVACHLAMTDAGLDFRATKDLDIVLCIEAITPEFVNTLWEFIAAGGYLEQEMSEQEMDEQENGIPQGNKPQRREQFYRFAKPTNSDYPFMLELFSRVPDTVNLQPPATLTPIPMGGQADSLSAILLDDDYYHCIAQGRAVIDGVPILGAEYILPFKAKAWLDLSARKARGEPIDSRNIKKHRNDVLRLSNLLTPTQAVAIPDVIKADLHSFLVALENEANINLRDFDIRNRSLAELVQTLRDIYGLAHE